jgi:hypothetical protein
MGGHKIILLKSETDQWSISLIEKKKKNKRKKKTKRKKDEETKKKTWHSTSFFIFLAVF